MLIHGLQVTGCRTPKLEGGRELPQYSPSCFPCSIQFGPYFMHLVYDSIPSYRTSLSVKKNQLVSIIFSSRDKEPRIGQTFKKNLSFGIFQCFLYQFSWFSILLSTLFIVNGPCGSYVVFIPGIRFSILNELTFQVTWLHMTRHHLHIYVGVAA